VCTVSAAQRATEQAEELLVADRGRVLGPQPEGPRAGLEGGVPGGESAVASM
jgi:hypothetical protein